MPRGRARHDEREEHELDNDVPLAPLPPPPGGVGPSPDIPVRPLPAMAASLVSFAESVRIFLTVAQFRIVAESPNARRTASATGLSMNPPGHEK